MRPTTITYKKWNSAVVVSLMGATVVRRDNSTMDTPKGEIVPRGSWRGEIAYEVKTEVQMAYWTFNCTHQSLCTHTLTFRSVTLHSG